jgi:hypothetical protein
MTSNPDPDPFASRDSGVLPIWELEACEPAPFLPLAAMPPSNCASEPPKIVSAPKLRGASGCSRSSMLLDLIARLMGVLALARLVDVAAVHTKIAVDDLHDLAPCCDAMASP